MSRDDRKDDPVDIELVRRLAEVLSDNDLTEIEVEVGELKIKVARSMQFAGAAPMQMLQPAAPVQIAGPAASTAAPAAVAEPAGDTVKSPMVGTVYLQPNPGAAAFAKVGDTVSAGQTLMIIEAMKTMNPVPAPRAGKVLEFLVDDGQPVEFGEPLVVIE